MHLIIICAFQEMFKIIYVLCAIGAAINAKRIFVTENLACDTKDETILYYNHLQLTCDNSRCNLDYLNNKKYCVPDKDCFGFFKCEGRTNYVARDGSPMKCGTSFVCNEKYAWPCVPCLKEACVTNTFTCDKSNEQLVNILVPFPTTMICPGDTVCNRNKVYPCEWCISRDSGDYDYYWDFF